MKKFAFVLCMLVTSAFAGEVKVLDIQTHSQQTVAAAFGWNEELGRVWVEMTVTEAYNYDDSDTGDFYRTKVDGLSYDAHSKTINLDIDGQLVECAEVRQRGVLVFRHNYLKATNCSFKTKVVTVLHDNGYEIEKRTRFQAFLVTK